MPYAPHSAGMSLLVDLILMSAQSISPTVKMTSNARPEQGWPVHTLTCCTPENKNNVLPTHGSRGGTVQKTGSRGREAQSPIAMHKMSLNIQRYRYTCTCVAACHHARLHCRSHAATCTSGFIDCDTRSTRCRVALSARVPRRNPACRLAHPGCQG